MKILSKTNAMLNAKGFRVINIDATIMAEAPKMSPYRAEMQKNISRIIEIDSDRVNVKATTVETLGMIGRGEGIAAFCVALIE
jgi:2-C-methyl-D-erythritol 2,4-cyclodiphosphate synthase